MQNQCIVDYGHLAFSIANAVWDENIVTKLDNFQTVAECFKTRYSDYAELLEKKALGFLLTIPGKPTNQLIIVDAADPNTKYTRFYRKDNMLIQVICIDLSITRNPDVTMEDLANFCIDFNKQLQLVYDDNYLTFIETMILSQFTTFAMVYYKYRLVKEDFIELGKLSKAALPCIEDNNKVYENFVSLLYSKNCSEEMIFRCYDDGTDNVEPNNLFKSRIVQ